MKESLEQSLSIAKAPLQLQLPAEALQITSEAVLRGLEAIFEVLQDEESLWSLGEQAVSIFVDVWQVSPPSTRERISVMAKSLLERLSSRAADWEPGCEDFDMPSSSIFDHWVYEALGLLWWQAELDVLDEDLLRKTKAEMERRRYAGFGDATAELAELSFSELCDLLLEVWVLERAPLVWDIDASHGRCRLGELLQELRRRSLPHPAGAEFYDAFYLVTHAMFVLNGFNSVLPRHRQDCAWAYAFLEQSLRFWLQEGLFLLQGDFHSLHMDQEHWGSESLDAIAEAVDILSGLEEDSNSELKDLLSEASAFLLSRQGEDGLFSMPKLKSARDDDIYTRIHPTWTSVAALQLDRMHGAASERSVAWVRYAESEAKRVGFAQ